MTQIPNIGPRGRRDLDTGSQPIPDPVELRQIRRQARLVHLKSLVTAAVLTILIAWV